jgi:hypothetical protein
MPVLQQTVMSGRDIRALVRCERFLDCDRCSVQLLFLRELCRLNCGLRANNAFLSCGFDISRGYVAKMLWKARKEPQAPGRPLTVTEEHEAPVIADIRETSRARNFVTRGAVVRFIDGSLAKTVTVHFFCQLQPES